MKKRNIIITCTIILSVVLYSNVISFAATDTSQLQAEPGGINVCRDLTAEQREAVHNAMLESRENAIENLVKDGTITQAEADQLLKAGFSRIKMMGIEKRVRGSECNGQGIGFKRFQGI